MSTQGEKDDQGETGPFERLDPVRHDLAPDYPALRAIPTRRDLAQHPKSEQWAKALRSVLPAVERGVHRHPLDPSPNRLRAVAWNIQRGARFEALVRALRNDASLREADVLMLAEVDNGMGRSGRRNVARDLAAALRMHYAFGVCYLVLGDDLLENQQGEENSLALAGHAILSRYPIGWVENADLPETKDKFSSRSEKRLGKKRALLAEITLPSGPLVLACCHLDSNASPAQRAGQMDFLLDRARARGERILLGGDLNTTTYDASGFGALMWDLGHKAIHHGFDATVAGYMVPENTYEKPLFEVLARHGLRVEGFNDRTEGTFNYDMNDPYSIAKLHKKVGRLLTWMLDRRLRPCGGVCRARLDWFAGKGIEPIDASVVSPAREEGIPVSDHAAIVVDVRL